MSNAPINIQGLAPVLLVSVPQLEDPDFRQSVILLCEHDSSGAFGLVLNRPTETLASSVVRFRSPIQAVNGLELWIGGPVDPSRGWILLPYEPTDGESVCVGKGLFLSTSEDILRRLLEDPTEVEARLLTGHAGWDAGQLDAELADLKNSADYLSWWY